ncbi:MAG TPA: SRPBCC family protein [Nitrospiraceae bacterium]|nr:SRPBCC family protein [Nitrospiraceae bacterium]
MQPSFSARKGNTSGIAREQPDIGDLERLLCGMTGAAFLLHGVKRRRWDGFATALLGGAFLYIGATGRNSLYRGLGIHLVRTTTGRQRSEVVRSITINRPVGELFAFWRDFRNLPTVMSHLETVEVVSEKRSHWKAKAPAGAFVEWDAEIVNEKKDALIAWQSCEGSSIANWGAVRFNPAPGNRGTEVTVELEYEPIGGATGVALAKLFGEEPSQQIEEDLRRFKQVMETGEFPTTAGQPRGGRDSAWFRFN